MYTGHLLMVVPDNAEHTRAATFFINEPYKANAKHTINLTVWPHSEVNLYVTPQFFGSNGPTLAIFDVQSNALGTTQTAITVSAQFTERGVSIGKQFEVFLDYIVIV